MNWANFTPVYFILHSQVLKMLNGYSPQVIQTTVMHSLNCLNFQAMGLKLHTFLGVYSTDMDVMVSAKVFKCRLSGMSCYFSVFVLFVTF